MIAAVLCIGALVFQVWAHMLKRRRERLAEERAILDSVENVTVYLGRFTKRELQAIQLHRERGIAIRQALGELMVLGKAAEKELAEATAVQKKKGRRKKVG